MLIIKSQIFNTWLGAVNPLNDGLLSAYYFDGDTLAEKGINDGIGVDVTYASDTQGQKAVFNGTSSRVYIDASTDFDVNSGDFAINVDFDVDTVGITNVIASVYNTDATPASCSFEISIGTDNKVNALFAYGGSYYILTSTNTVSVSTKYSLVVQRTGTTYTMYLNGASEDSDTFANTINLSNYKIAIGAAGEYNAGFFFSGSISAVRTWSRVLTAPEITSLYNSGNGNKFAVQQSAWGANALTAQPIDGNALGYATFQSHSQKTVVNDNGIFSIVLHSTSNYPTFTNQTWHLHKSLDGGRTTSIVYTDTCTSSVPNLETDSSNNLYITYIENGTTVGFLKFDNTDYTTPSVNVTAAVTTGSAKHCMGLDDTNNKIYYFCGHHLVVFNKAGTVLQASTAITQAGATAFTSYPSVTINNGVVYYAWTTQKTATPPVIYYDMHWAKSSDYGATWTKSDGTALTLPIVADDGGAAESINLPGEVNVGVWLGAWSFVNERLHAVYSYTGNGHKYVRINPTTGTKEETSYIYSAADLNPDGAFMRDVSGTFANPTAMYYTMGTSTATVLSTYVSTDNGATWSLYTERDRAYEEYTYAICAYREQINGRGYGTFTVVNGRGIGALSLNESGYAYLFKLNI